jgi:hypothetical protein
MGKSAEKQTLVAKAAMDRLEWARTESPRPPISFPMHPPVCACLKVVARLPGNQFDTALRSFHGFPIDAGPERRYSERIHSKDLVTIANSKLRLPHLKCVVPTTLYPAPQFPTTNLHMVTVSTADLGGYFSA